MRHVLVALVVVAGCSAGPINTPNTPTPPDSGCPDVCIDRNEPKTKVDLLFVLDDAPSMAVKLATLRAALPKLVATLDGYAHDGSPVSYHLGVVTADLGAGPTAIDGERCRVAGDGAQLRTGPAADAQAPAACAGLSLTGGVRYIDYNQIAGTSNIDGGFDVATALSCLSEVGSAGCEFRHPLEASYRALHDQIAENAGFLRSDAALAVIFVSDADDCSVPPPSTLFDPSSAGVASFGPLDHFRCTQFGVACNGQPVPATPVSGLTGCESQRMEDAGQLYDLDRYINFFTKPAAQGGVKVDPNDVILAAIAGPSDPVGVQIVSPCPDRNGGASCPVLNHSCVSVSDTTFFGDPAVRLNAVVSSARNNDKASICDGDDTPSLQSIGQFIGNEIVRGCFTTPIANRSDGTPDCIVTDVTANPDGSTTTTEIPSCAENAHVIPCWQLVDQLPTYTSEGCTPLTQPPPSSCTLPPQCQPVTNPLDHSQQLFTLTVDRGGNSIPPATRITVSCASPSS